MEVEVEEELEEVDMILSFIFFHHQYYITINIVCDRMVIGNRSDGQRYPKPA